MEKPTMQQRINALGRFIWDSESGKVLGRGGRSWAEIGLFYLVYYACLTAFFVATIAVFYQTIDDHQPKLQSDSSLLKGNPGMGFRPRPDNEEIGITSKTNGKNKDFTDNMKKFLKPYKRNDLHNTVCHNIGSTRPGEKVSCKVDTDEFNGVCDETNEFGMKDGQPCVLLKLNKVFGWEPEMWDDAPDHLPDDISYDKTVVPVKCYAKDDDEQQDLGTIMYYPKQGYDIHYFPWEGQKDYRAPIVMAKFANMTVGKNIEIECRTYAKNIKFDRTDNEGGVKFELKIVA